MGVRRGQTTRCDQALSAVQLFLSSSPSGTYYSYYKAEAQGKNSVYLYVFVLIQKSTLRRSCSYLTSFQSCDCPLLRNSGRTHWFWALEGHEAPPGQL
jgi:hypothetical protein